MNEEFGNNQSIDSELQVRLMNLVMGEASDFERDQLQALMEQRAELASYYHHVEHLHGLLCEVASGELSTESTPTTNDDAWQLPSDRRQHVLAVLDGVEHEPTGKVALSESSNARRWFSLSPWTAMGAAVTAACVFLSLMLPALYNDMQGISKTATSISPKQLGLAHAQSESNEAEFQASRQRALSERSRASKLEGHDNLGDTYGGTQLGRTGPVNGSAVMPEEAAMGMGGGMGMGMGGMGMETGAGKMTGGADFELGVSGMNERLGDGEAPVGETAVPGLATPRIIVQEEADKSQTLPRAYYFRDDVQHLQATTTARSLPRLRSFLDQVEGRSVAETEVLRSRFFDFDAGKELSENATLEKLREEPPLAELREKREKESRAGDAKILDQMEAATLSLGGSSVSEGEKALQGLFRKSQEGKNATEALNEMSATAAAFSTFSLHVSDVSFKLALAAFNQGQWPEAEKIRIEEFVNAIDYHDPLPTGTQRVACQVEQAIHPFLMQRNLLRISVRTAASGRSQNTSLRLTLLLDNSGSMERPDRRQAVLRAFQTLTEQLNAADQVTLISFASTPRLLADKVPGNQGETLLKLVENLPSQGGTNIEAALKLAREKATEQMLAGAQNRIVLMTDGAVNLGDADPDSLAKLVAQLRDSGIAFDAAGISAQDLNDEVLEALTRQGDGRYYLLGSVEDASEGFAAQIAGALRPSAQNVKVQVEFNPKRVGRYKLLGFEKHLLNREDFRNDQVDAAEMAAAEAGVAVYQCEAMPGGSGDIGSVSVRFRDLTTDQMVEQRWPILYEPNAPRLEQATPSMQLAASAALFATKLKGGPLADSVDLAQLQSMLAALPERVAKQPRVQQLRNMFSQAMK